MSREAWEISDFQTSSGSYPVRRFLTGLTMEQKTNALALIQLLRERGNSLRKPHSGPLGGGLFELRDVGSGVRVFYTFLPGRRAVLLGGMVKKRGRIPPAALEEARRHCGAARASGRRG
jgi:hypothetical protein